MQTVLIALGGGVGIFMLLKIWNHFSSQYNHKILQQSKCKNCSEVLGIVALEKAVSELKKEKEQLKREAKFGTAKLHNMKLVCQNCGTENNERDLYEENRKNS